MYILRVKYKEYKPSPYKGIIISDASLPKGKQDIVKVNTGSIELDERRALHQLYDLVGEVDITYSSSYDNYFMDLDYENDPETRASVDAMEKELNEKIERYKKEIGKKELSIDELNYAINRKE
mgnify:CR=1 FL=1